MKSRVIVAVIVKKDESYLLGMKPQDVGPYPNTWHLLGGGVNLEEETLEDAVRREIKEESDIKVRDIKRVSFDEDYEPDKKGEQTHYVFLVYEAIYQSGEVKPQDDITQLKWFHQSELRTIPLTRPTEKLFKELQLL